MKAVELARYLLEHPDWSVEFFSAQGADEVDDFYERTFDDINVGTDDERKVFVFRGDERG